MRSWVTGVTSRSVGGRAAARLDEPFVALDLVMAVEEARGKVTGPGGRQRRRARTSELGYRAVG